MKLINRSAFSLLPKQAFADWANALSADELNEQLSLEDHRREASVYMVDEFQDETDVPRLLEQHFTSMFENELAAWDEFGDDWPDARSFELFQQWFDVTPQVIAIDLSAEPLMLAPLTD